MTKVKVDLKDAKIKIDIFTQQGARVAGEILKKEVITEISQGRSPVARQGRYVKYSQSYQQAIDNGQYSSFNKRKRPVNLKLSGNVKSSGSLLSSIFTRDVSKGRILIGFDNFLADIHNRQGAGKSKTVRRMLPTNQGERFAPIIIQRVAKELSKVANRIFK